MIQSWDTRSINKFARLERTSDSGALQQDQDLRGQILQIQSHCIAEREQIELKMCENVAPASVVEKYDTEALQVLRPAESMQSINTITSQKL